MTFFGHAIVGAALVCGQSLILRKRPKPAFIIIGAFVAAAPDLDVIFRVVGEQKPVWAHRGITHSMGFALVMAIVFGSYRYFFGKTCHRAGAAWRGLALVFALLASHGCIDALTNKGPRVLLFFPVSLEAVRAPDPYRFIPVSLIPFEGADGNEKFRNDIMTDESLPTWLPRRLVRMNESAEWVRPAYMTGVILTEFLICLPLLLLMFCSFRSPWIKDCAHAPQR